MELEDPDPASDVQLREELLAAREWGVSHRRYCGWEPVRTTTYEYDPDGWLVRAVTTMEPEWDDEQREMAQALRRYEATLCPGCGGDLHETTDPANEYGYVRHGPPRCLKCQMIEMYQEADAEAKTPQPQSLLYGVRLKPPEAPDGE